MRSTSEGGEKVRKKSVFCNPDICPNCQYIGDGDSYCDEIGEIVLSDWDPTEHFMGRGCPYARKKKGGKES